MNRLRTLSKCDRLEIFQTYCFIQLHTQFCSLGINFNVCFVFYVDGGNLAKYFPLSPQLDFPSGSLHSIFKYCSLRQIVFCQLDLGSSQTHGAKRKWGTLAIIKFSPRDVVVLRKIYFQCEETEETELKAPFAQWMPRN